MLSETDGRKELQVLIKATSVAQIGCGAVGDVGDEEVLMRKQYKEDQRHHLELAGKNIGSGKQRQDKRRQQDECQAEKAVGNYLFSLIFCMGQANFSAGHSCTWPYHCC